VTSPDEGDGCPDVEQLLEVAGQSLVSVDVDLVAVPKEHVQAIGVVGVEVGLKWTPAVNHWCFEIGLLKSVTIDCYRLAITLQIVILFVHSVRSIKVKNWLTVVLSLKSVQPLSSSEGIALGLDHFHKI